MDCMTTKRNLAVYFLTGDTVSCLAHSIRNDLLGAFTNAENARRAMEKCHKNHQRIAERIAGGYTDRKLEPLYSSYEIKLLELNVESSGIIIEMYRVFEGVLKEAYNIREVISEYERVKSYL